MIVQDVQVSGVVTATSFHGDASQLTNLPAAGSSLEEPPPVEHRWF